MKKDWFAQWFDTPYYHILYKHRNSTDAELLMRKITEFLALEESSTIVDLPCGKGRHAIFLNSLGYNVFGGDLSKNSIDYAKQFENENLHFEVWDMREPLQNKYDAVFNLFTSFGYFESDDENITVLKSLRKGLKSDSYIVIDFLNVEKIRAAIVPFEVKVIDGIEFSITREIKYGFIVKNIHFFAEGQEHHYTERVKCIDLEKFQDYFNQADLEIMNIFGDYSLNDFDAKTSNRLILIGKKKN